MKYKKAVSLFLMAIIMLTSTVAHAGELVSNDVLKEEVVFTVTPNLEQNHIEERIKQKITDSKIDLKFNDTDTAVYEDENKIVTANTKNIGITTQKVATKKIYLKDGTIQEENTYIATALNEITYKEKSKKSKATASTNKVQILSGIKSDTKYDQQTFSVQTRIDFYYSERNFFSGSKQYHLVYCDKVTGQVLRIDTAQVTVSNGKLLLKAQGNGYEYGDVSRPLGWMSIPNDEIMVTTPVVGSTYTNFNDQRTGGGGTVWYDVIPVTCFVHGKWTITITRFGTSWQHSVEVTMGQMSPI